MMRGTHYTVPCGYCGAEPGTVCMTSTGKLLAIGHMWRLQDQYPCCRRCGLELIDGRCQILGCGA